MRSITVACVCYIFVCASTAAYAQSLPNAQLPAGAAREKVEASCLTCHDARIIVQQRLSKPAWTKELDKMIKWGAEVDANDHDVLIDYFTVNFGADRAPYDAPRSTSASSSKTKGKQ